MQVVIILVHLMIVLAMIGVVLLQKSEGGGLGIGSTGATRAAGAGPAAGAGAAGAGPARRREIFAVLLAAAYLVPVGLAFAGQSWLPLFLSFKWPSVAYALDILAWDVFFAFSMFFAAPVFGGSRLAASIRALMIASGNMLNVESTLSIVRYQSHRKVCI